MLNSIHITFQHRGNDKVELKRITSLVVYNDGNMLCHINGQKIEPQARVNFVVPDGTFSDILLDISFTKVPISIVRDTTNNGGTNGPTDPTPREPPLNPTETTPPVFQNTILLIYKKLV